MTFRKSFYFLFQVTNGRTAAYCLLSSCPARHILQHYPLHNFGFRERAASNAKSYPTFRQTLQLQSSGWISSGTWRIWLAERVSGLIPNWQQARAWKIFRIRPSSSQRAEVVDWIPAAKTEGKIYLPPGFPCNTTFRKLGLLSTEGCECRERIRAVR